MRSESTKILIPKLDLIGQGCQNYLHLNLMLGQYFQSLFGNIRAGRILFDHRILLLINT